MGCPIQNKSEYGYFTKTFEFKLTDPRTPRPWSHLMSNDNYLLTMSQLGSGYSCYKSRYGNLVTKNVEPDRADAGRFFYIRDKDSGDFFSPMIFPCQIGLENYSDYECIYGPGSLTWNILYKEIQSQLKTLVCIDENVELYLLTLENNEKKRVELDCFLFLEWDFGGAPTEGGGSINTCFDESLNAHVANLNIPPQYRFHQTGFITSTEPVVDFDSRYLAFVGPMGTISSPIAVINGKCSNSGEPIIGTTCGAVRVSVSLDPSESRQVMFAVGIASDVDKLHDLIPRFHKNETFDTEFDKVNSFWRNILTKQNFQGPSGMLTGFSNTWLKYQVVQNARWTRWGSDKGYRDVLNDAAGLRLLNVPQAKSMILDALRHQRSDGHAPRQWSNVPWRQCDWRDYRDSCLWLIYAIEAYLRESGDLDFLDEKLCFCDEKNCEPVWEHMNRALDFLYSHRGKHGLCLMGQGDWLDSLNQAGIKGKGESVWLSQLLAWSFKTMGEIAVVSNRADYKDKYEYQYNSMYEAINEHGWDGNWYLKGYTDNGEPIGSCRCNDGGKIFLNPQSWAVISGTAPADRVKLSFNAVEKHLHTEWGPLLYSPRYSRYDKNIGRLSIGSSEVDAVYVHAVTFKILAELMLGNSEKAWSLIEDIVPAIRRLPASQSSAEPFCCVNAFAGEGWSWPGWSYVGWWSATGGWLLQLMVEWVYGARADFNGLKIDPCFPQAFNNAKMIRNFRGASYDIEFKRIKDKHHQKIQIEADGKVITSGLLPIYAEGTSHSIKCLICDS